MGGGWYKCGVVVIVAQANFIYSCRLVVCVLLALPNTTQLNLSITRAVLHPLLRSYALHHVLF